MDIKNCFNGIEYIAEVSTILQKMYYFGQGNLRTIP